MSFKPFFQSLTASQFKTHRLQTALIVFSVMLGVLLFSTVLNLNHSILAHFKKSVYSLTAQNLLPVWSESGEVPADLYSKLQSIEGVESILPIREVTSLWSDKNLPVKIRYLDFLEMAELANLSEDEPKVDFRKYFEDEKSALISQSLEKRLKLKTNLALTHSGQTQTYSILDSLPQTPDSDVILYQDISHSSFFWKNPNTLTRLELKLDPAHSQRAVAKIKELLPAGVVVGELEKQYAQGQKMISSFQTNLLCVSFVSVLVSFFLIYLSFSLGLQQRRQQISLLLSMGSDASQVMRYLFLEALALGAISSLFGIILGHFTADFLMEIVSRSISQIYFPMVAQSSFSWKSAILSMGMGLLATLMAALQPVLEVRRIALKDYLTREAHEINFEKYQGPLLGIGIGFLILALIAYLISSFERPYFTLATCLFFILGMISIIPTLLARYFSGITRLFPKRSLLQLNETSRYLFRYTLITASLVMAYSFTFAVIDMTSSFRHTVVQWVDSQFHADIVIAPNDRYINPYHSYLPSEVTEAISEIPNVKAVGFKSERLKMNGGFVSVFTTDIQTYFKLKVLSKKATTALSKNLIPAYVSDNFLLRQNLKLGDTFNLQFPNHHTVQFGIVATFEDYSSENGIVYFDESKSAGFFPHDQSNVMHLYVTNPKEIPALLEQLKTQFAGRSIEILSHADLRKVVLDIFDQTFLLANALQWLSLTVAFTGFLINLTLILSARQFSFSLLRVMGLSLIQGIWLVFIENLLVIGFALIWSIGAGFGLLLILIYGVQKYYFSWIIHLNVDPINWGVALAGLSFMALITTTFVLVRAFSKQPIESLRYE